MTTATACYSPFIPAFESLGGQVTNKTSPTRYPPDSSVFDSVVRTAFQGNPDAVLLIAYPETGSLILKAAYQQGLLGGKTKVLATDGMKEAKIADLIGKTTAGQYIAAGILGTAPHAGGPALSDFQRLYSQHYQRSPKIYDANTWDAMAVLVLAAEAAKSTAGAAIKNAIQDVANPPGEPVTNVCEALAKVRAGQAIDYQGASSRIDFNALGDVTGGYDIWTIAPDGRLKIIGTIAATSR